MDGVCDKAHLMNRAHVVYPGQIVRLATHHWEGEDILTVASVLTRYISFICLMFVAFSLGTFYMWRIHHILRI